MGSAKCVLTRRRFKQNRSARELAQACWRPGSFLQGNTMDKLTPGLVIALIAAVMVARHFESDLNPAPQWVTTICHHAEMLKQYGTVDNCISTWRRETFDEGA